MNLQLTKELRPLLLPWLVAAAAGLFQAHSSEFFFALSGFVFFGTAVVLVATAFGNEFQHRTLWLVLTQPSDRAKVWDKKTLAVAIALGTLALLDCRLQRALNEIIPLPWFFTTATIALIVCAAGFWNGKGHSPMAATALSLVTNLTLLAATVWAVMVWFVPGPYALNVLVLAFLIYPLAYILLGWSFWRDKMLLLALVTLGILLLAGLGSFSASFTNTDQGELSVILLTFTFFVVTVCSGGFWTLVAKSTVGGAAFTFAAEFALALTVVATAHKAFEFPTEITDLRIAMALAAFGLLYSGVFLWLGRASWRTLQLRENVAGESTGWTLPTFEDFGFLRCQSGSLMLNLFRKEIRLQRPLVLLAALFTGCWAIAVAAAMITPAVELEIVMPALFIFYTPLYLLLAGCISLSDEMTLGTMPWHLTFPTNPWRLWFAKIVTGGALGLLLGIALPILLGGLTQLATGKLTPFYEQPLNLLIVAAFAFIFYLMSFWSATLVAGTVRAALTALVLTAGFTALYVWGGNLGRELDLLDPQLPAAVFAFLQTASLPGFLVNVPLAGMIGVVPLALFIVWQSSVEFHHPQPKPYALWKRAISTGILAFVVPVVLAGSMNSANLAFRMMGSEFREAAKIVLEKAPALAPGKTRNFTTEELIATGILSPTTAYWLRGCTFECSRISAPKSDPDVSTRFSTGKPHLLKVTFPGRGELYEGVYVTSHRPE